MTTLALAEGLSNMNALTSADMSAEMISATLAKINRFAGRTREPYSVAAHSVLVSRLCTSPSAQARGLLHDAHEAFLGDIITPAVDFIAAQSLPIAGAMVQNCVAEAKKKLDAQIFNAWDINRANEVRAEVDYYDRVALRAELMMFFGWQDPQDAGPCDDVDRAIDLMRALPTGDNWRSSAGLWASEAERFAQVGALRIPAAASAAA